MEYIWHSGGGLLGENGGRRGVGSGAAVAGCPRRMQLAGVNLRFRANGYIAKPTKFQPYFLQNAFT